LAKNTKAKIARTNKNYGIDLSSEINLPDSIENFSNRSEFNQWKERQASFTNRANTHFQFKKNEFDVVATKKQLNEIERKTKEAQRLSDQFNQKVDKQPFTSGGKEQGTVAEERWKLGKPLGAGIRRPLDFDFDRIKSQRELENKLKSSEKRADPIYYNKRMEIMQRNFIENIRQSLNSDGDELVKKLELIPPDDFYEMYLMFDEFDFALWDSEGILFGNHEEAMQHVSQMLSYVERYEQKKINFDLKGI
jgi:hypothetical protein